MFKNIFKYHHFRIISFYFFTPFVHQDVTNSQLFSWTKRMAQALEQINLKTKVTMKEPEEECEAVQFWQKMKVAISDFVG